MILIVVSLLVPTFIAFLQEVDSPYEVSYYWPINSIVCFVFSRKLNILLEYKHSG